MALDFVLLSKDGKPQSGVPLDMNSHLELVQMVKSLGLPLSLRFADYYSDATIMNAELTELSREIARLEALPCSSALKAFFARLMELVEVAVKSHSDLHIISD
jgi:hypothetical protein